MLENVWVKVVETHFRPIMFSHAVLRFALVYIVTQGTIGKQRLQKLLLSLYAVDNRQRVQNLCSLTKGLKSPSEPIRSQFGENGISSVLFSSGSILLTLGLKSPWPSAKSSKEQ